MFLLQYLSEKSNENFKLLQKKTAIKMNLLYVALLVIGSNHLFAYAMHGGELYEIEKVPYVAQFNHVYESGSMSLCGAAILSERWILTASHCTFPDDGEELLYSQIRVGTNKTFIEGKLHNISRIINHEEYSVETRWINDISLIELAEPIEFNDKSQPISISKSAPRIQCEITIAGYGDDKDEPGWDLKMGQQTVISRKECMRAFANTPQNNFAIDDRAFCADSTFVDAGHGDSGSSAVLNGEIVGIAVEGDESPLPNIYINVAHYYDWIVDTTGIKFD